MRKLYILIAMTLTCVQMQAQYNEIYNDQIHSLQVVANEDWLSPPVMELGGSNKITIDFDDFTHTYHRYAYKIEHCEADWSTSDQIFESDYMEGFNENLIDDYAKSFNTTVLYTHYSISLPNSDCSLKISGNYRLTVYDNDNDDAKVLTACFMIVDPLMNVTVSATTNTDIDVNDSHQQVDFTVGYGNINVTDPAGQIATVVMQNGRRDNCRVNLRPNYIANDKLTWTHNRSLIFTAGNEYHKFEMLDVHHPTLGIDRIDFIGDYFHCMLFDSEPRKNYTYDVDADGSFYIRNSDNEESSTTCDYLWVHYTLKCEPVNGHVYVNGAWTHDQFLPQYEMTYNQIKKCYEATILQKQGYYSYQYLMVGDDGSTSFLPSEGNFFQTENKYQVLVYYKGTGERTYRLVGYTQTTINERED